MFLRLSTSPVGGRRGWVSDLFQRVPAKTRVNKLSLGLLYDCLIGQWETSHDRSGDYHARKHAYKK